MEEIDVFRAHLLRSDVDQSWGLELQGGSEVNQRIKISEIASGSSADSTGLKVDDEVTEIGGVSTVGLTLPQVLEVIRQQTGETLSLTIERKVVGSTSIRGDTGSDVTGQISPKEHKAIYQTEWQDRIRPTEIKPNKAEADASFSPAHSANDMQTTGNEQEDRRGDPLSSEQFDHLPINEIHSFQPQDVVAPSYLPSTSASGPLRYSPGPQKTPFQFQTAHSRPFVEPVSKQPVSRRTRPAPSAAGPTQPIPPAPATRPFYQPQDPPEVDPHFELLPSNCKSDYSTYLHEDDVNAGEFPQSRTFRMLQSVMSNEEPGAGAAGLPPPRSAEKERLKRDGSAASSPRIKVLVSQKYNSPMGMYSANSVIESFAAHAETVLETLEKQHQPPEYRPVFASPMHG